MGDGGFHYIYDNKDVYIFIDNGSNNIYHYHRDKIEVYPPGYTSILSLW